MIIRIVKMTFQSGKTNDFLDIFNQRKERIAACNGCSYVSLQHDIENPAIFFTISKWNSENDLENYRNSELFKETWKLTKALFEKPAEAWSVQPEFQSCVLF
jgi:heme-degrading monooxygenase HmoA